MVAGDVSQKDVVLAVLTASAAIVGLVLVFLGLIVSSYEGYEAAQQTAVRGRYRVLASWMLVDFAVGLACLGLTTAWLLWQGNTLYGLAVILFSVQLLLLAVAASLSIRDLLWG